jgi:hypothetical protein
MVRLASHAAAGRRAQAIAQFVAVGCVITAARRVPHPRNAQDAVHFYAKEFARFDFYRPPP